MRKGYLVALTAAAAGSVWAYTAVSSERTASVAAPETKAKQQLTEFFSDYELMDLSLPAHALASFDLQVTLGGRQHTLHLDPYTKRRPNFKVMVPRDGTLVEIEAPAPATMRGYLEDVPDSIVSASVREGRLNAYILMGQETWYIQPVTDVLPDAAAGRHVAYNALDAIPVEGTCGNIDLAEGNHDHAHDHAEAQDPGAGEPVPAAAIGSDPGAEDGVLRETDIAIDADWEYYNLNGRNVNATIADIENIISNVSTIYERDVNICYNITLIIVRDQEPDPYTSTDPGTLLGRFRSHWNSQQTGNRTDTMHLFTGKNINGGVIGIANCIGCICSLSSSYALSQARFTGIFSWRVGLVAHEIGHLYGAFHCCGGCSGCSTCQIMCPCLAGCSGIVTEFGPQSINSISAHRDSRNCLIAGCLEGETVCPSDPNDWQRLFGGTTSGDASNLCASDDVRLEVRQQAQVAPTLPFIRLEYWAYSTLSGGEIGQLDYMIECHVSALVGGGQNPNTLRTYIRNYLTNSFELVDQRGTASSTDEVINHAQTSNPAFYVSFTDGEVRVRQDVFSPGDTFSPNWFLKVDAYEVTVSPP